jgi:hypothetical protein
MGYSKIYYSLLELKKVLISTYFNVMIYIEFELLTILTLYFVNYIFLTKIFCFLGRFTYLLFIYIIKFFFSFLFN